MKPIRSMIFVAAATIIAGALAVPAIAKTPADMLVIAGQIDDITTLDPAQSFEFSGGDISHPIDGKIDDGKHRRTHLSGLS